MDWPANVSGQVKHWEVERREWSKRLDVFHVNIIYSKNHWNLCSCPGWMGQCTGWVWVRNHGRVDARPSDIAQRQSLRQEKHWEAHPFHPQWPFQQVSLYRMSRANIWCSLIAGNLWLRICWSLTWSLKLRSTAGRLNRWIKARKRLPDWCMYRDSFQQFPSKNLILC